MKTEKEKDQEAALTGVKLEQAIAHRAAELQLDADAEDRARQLTLRRVAEFNRYYAQDIRNLATRFATIRGLTDDDVNAMLDVLMRMPPSTPVDEPAKMPDRWDGLDSLG